jgi:hypothetical protein
MKDRVQLDIDNHEQAQELIAANLDAEMDKVWNEISNGDHDEALSDNSFIDRILLTRIARILVYRYDKEIATAIPKTDIDDLHLQITDYVKDVAERNLLND